MALPDNDTSNSSKMLAIELTRIEWEKTGGECQVSLEELAMLKTEKFVTAVILQVSIKKKNKKVQKASYMFVYHSFHLCYLYVGHYLENNTNFFQ